MSLPPESPEIAQRRARARRTAAWVTLVAVAIYAMFWFGGVLRT